MKQGDRKKNARSGWPGASGWRLFGVRFGPMLRQFYRQAGLALLVLVTASIFAAAAYFEPELFVSRGGSRRATAILVFCGIPAIPLAAIYFAYLQPRAVLMAYRTFAAMQSGSREGESETDAFCRRKGVYWWVVLLRLVPAVAFGLAGAAASRWIGGRFSPRSWGVAAVWALCVMLFWQARIPVSLALPAAARSRVSGVGALRCGLRAYRGARDAASLAGLITLCAVMLSLVGILGFSGWIAREDPLMRYSIAAFLAAVLYPPLRLLLAAFDTAVYTETRRGRVRVKRWNFSASRLRKR